MEPQKLGFVLSLATVCGMLTTSLSLVYGRWSASWPISHYINLHSVYIAGAGFGLLCSLGVVASLKKRIEVQESALNQMKGEK